MPTLSVEGLFLTLVLFLMAGNASARPRRRFCEHYPFAPRCLGVAAKREAVQPNIRSDIPINELEELLASRTVDSEQADNWQHKDKRELLVPYNVLTNLIRERMSESQLNQNRNIGFWDEFEEIND